METTKAADINWNTATPEAAMTAVKEITATLTDPAKLWYNMDQITKALESTHGSAVFAETLKYPLVTDLRDAWLTMHNTTLEERDTYKQITGEGGYEDYRKAYHALHDALGPYLGPDDL